MMGFTKKWMGLALIAIVSGAIAVGCSRNIMVPTAPGVRNTYTNTPGVASTLTSTSTLPPTLTSTATLTSTVPVVFTATSTSTNSRTFTSTLSPTGTVAPANTSTSTPTLTLTATPSNTATPTNSSTRTSTPTATACTASSVQTSYNFDSNFSCWKLEDYSPTSSFDISPTTTHTGAGSLHAAINEGGTSAPIQFELDFSPNANLTGTTQISVWVYVTPSMVGASVQMFEQSGTNPGPTPAYAWDSGAWTTFTGGNVGQWIQLTWTPPTFGNGGDPSVVQRIGVQFYNMPTNTTGDIYVDDYQITNPGIPTDTSTPTLVSTDTPTNTSTPSDTNTATTVADTSTDTPTLTPTVAVPTDTPTNSPTATTCVPTLKTSYNFDSGTECWTAWQGGGAPALAAMTTYVDSVNTHTGAGALAVVIPFTAGTQQAMVGIDFSASPVSIPAGSILTFWYKSSVAGGNGQLFDESGSNTWDGGSWQNTLPATWTQVSFQMNPAVPGSIQQIGFQVPGTGGAFTSPVTIWIDDVTISPPPTPTPTLAADCAPLFNGAESLLDNGTWNGGGNATRSLSASHATQGNSSMDVNVTVSSGWNDSILQLDNFAPANWTNVVQLQADVYVDASLLSGGYGQLLLIADSGANGQYYKQISSTTPALVAGQQTVTWNIDYSGGGITAGMALSELRFIYNNGGGTGNLYIDNLHLIYNPCPPTPLYSWKFETDTESWVSGGWLNGGAGETVSQVAPGQAGSLGALNAYIPFANTGDQEVLAFNFPSDVDLTGRTIQADVWIDSAINPSGYPGGFLFVQSGSYILEQGPGTWNNLTKNGWYRLTFTPTWTATAGEDSTAVKQVGVLINVGTGVPAISPGNIKVDNVIIY